MFNNGNSLFILVIRSGALKEEYERCRLEVNRADEETQYSYQQKRGIAAERKEAKIEKDEAEKYAQLKQELVCLLILFYLCIVNI